MKEGDVVLAWLQQAAGIPKRRPAVILRALPYYTDFLLCGISTQLYQQVIGFDEVIAPSDADFLSSGLRAESLIRLGFVSVFSRKA